MPTEENPAPAAEENPTPSLMDEAVATPEVTTPEGEKPAGEEGEKPAEVTTPEGEKPEGEEGEKPEPIEYEDFTTPEGVTLDEEVLGEFKGIAKELGLPQDKAQKFVDMATQLQQKQADAFAHVQDLADEEEAGQPQARQHVGA